MIDDGRFIKFFSRLIKYEGGYVNDPDDPGGETKYGISKRSYPNEDIANLTEARAMQLYYKDYYLRLNIDKIKNDRIAWQLFDFGVNAGVSRSAKILQKIVGSYPDGDVGSKTLESVNSFKSRFPLYIYFQSERLKHYMDLTEKNESLLKFLKGWIIRTYEL